MQTEFQTAQTGTAKEQTRRKPQKRPLTVVLTTLAAILAAGILAGAFFLPVLRIYGSSMSPTLNKGEIVAVVRGQIWERGDVIAFSYHNKILIKRVIAGPGSEVNIGTDGAVYVDGEVLPETYLTERNAGNCTIELPCMVPEGQYFVLGDSRVISADSRNAEIGCIPGEQVMGRAVCRLWPVKRIGTIR